MPDEVPESEDVEFERVRIRRYREARDAGMSRPDALEFAADDSIDVGELRRLIEKGCPPETLAAILL